MSSISRSLFSGGDMKCFYTEKPFKVVEFATHNGTGQVCWDGLCQTINLCFVCRRNAYCGGVLLRAIAFR